MIKHYIDIATNTYIIEKDDVIIFSIELDSNGEDVHVRGINNEYIGDIKDLFLYYLSK